MTTLKELMAKRMAEQKPVPPSFKPRASVFMNERVILVQTDSGYHRGMRDYDGPLFALSRGCSDEELGDALCACIRASRVIKLEEVKHFFDLAWREKMPDRDAPIMETYGYRSREEFYRNMMFCMADRIDADVVILPWVHRGGERWSGPQPSDGIENVVVPFNSSPPVIGAALREGLSRCKQKLKPIR